MARYGNIVLIKGYITINQALTDSVVLCQNLPSNIVSGGYCNMYYYSGISEEPTSPIRLSLEVSGNTLMGRFGDVGYSYLVNYTYICADS